MSDVGGGASIGGRARRRARALAVAGAAVSLATALGCAREADDVPEVGGDAERGADEPAPPVMFEDHWHAAFGVYVCDEFLPPLPEFETADGIHTHGDGVIHIHPFTPDAAGDNATLRVFLEGAGVEVASGELSVDGETYTEGEDTCDGRDAEVAVVRWSDVAAGDAEPERVGADARFRGNGEGYVVAFVPEGADIPVPESVPLLDELGGTEGPGAVPTTTGPRDTTGEEGPAAAPDERSLPDGFYPVEAIEPAPCRTAGMRTDLAGERCYRLPDRPVAGPEIVEEADAAVAPAGGGWEVALTLGADGIEVFNDVAAECYERSATCPSGQLALLVDGEVVTAPQIAEPAFQRDEIVVSGTFTEDEARAVADALAP